MKLNLSKPFAKYALIAIYALIVFLLIYTYVKFTNDRVYELATEQVIKNAKKPELTKKASNIDSRPSVKLFSDTTSVEKPLSRSDAVRTDTRGVENKPAGKMFIMGKSAQTCMRELNTKIINNAVVNCTHDHYKK